MSVVIETTLGDFTVDLFIQERPQTCLNFLKLCKIKYYNLCLFHSVSSNFLAQTGDPTGKGDGGESIFGVIKGKQYRLYLGEKLPKIKHDRTGLLSMVSHGDGMLGSQFVITLNNNLSSLDNEHCVFGQIVEGEEVLLKLNEAITDEKHRPYQDIRITHTVILEDPFPDPEHLEVPPLSPFPPNPKDVAYSRIPADEPLADNYNQEQLDEIVQQREAAARAAILEMVGDIPDADAAPPENVLFVCKLNPVTSDHDLSIIFSRFGNVKSCEVIRDQVTGDSLQYAFVEFEDRKACEEAYFKMDNVLIDDRRIHVDFSQSVAKLKWKGKGRGVEVLGPPPSGGWGNRSRETRDDVKQSYDENRRNAGGDFKKNKFSDRHNDCDSIRNGKSQRGEIEVRHNNRKIFNEKKEIQKKNKLKRRDSTSTSSSSVSSSESSTSSESSETSYRKKKKSSRKVLVVVKTPRRSKTHKKPRKTKNRKYKSESESDSPSDSQKKKKKKSRRKSSSSDESSSEEELDKKRKRKRRSPSSDDQPKARKRKKKSAKNSESSDSSSEEEKKKTRSRKRRAKDSSSDSEGARNKKWKKEKVKSKKRKQGKKFKKSHRYDTESSSSSD